MKKGFTLIELLAVIVILAIIALIATPIILNIIDDTKQNADLISRNTYINEVERKLVVNSEGYDFSNSVCSVVESDTDNLSVGDLICDGIPIDIEISGTTATQGLIVFINGKAAIIQDLKVGNSVYNESSMESGLYDLNGTYIKTWQELIDEESITIQNTTLKTISQDMEGMLVIDDTITTLGYDVGSSCSLTAVVMPDSITTTTIRSFTNCSNLKTAIISKNLEALDMEMFSYTAIESILIPEGVKTIGRNAFRYTPIKSVSLPSTLTTIDMYAFETTPLESVVIPEGVTSIGWSAFRYDESLKNVKILGTQTNIGSQSFYGSGIEELYIKGGVIDMSAFSYCPNLNNVVIEEGITSIGMNAFAGSSINNIELPDSILSIGHYAFFNTTLGNITLGAGLTTIGESAFGNSTITSITIPASVTSIGRAAFSYTSNLTDVYFESTTNWSKGETPISSTDLANSATAATYLKESFDYAWTKSE